MSSKFDLNIGQQRLINQELNSPRFKKPVDLVHWLGAVQAQDYYGAKWALGQRLQGATDAKIERAFANGEILRTHVMRQTWHFVAPKDIRWLLQLTAPRVNSTLRSYYRKYELDEVVLRRCRKTIINALKGKHLTRELLRRALARAGISAEGLRFIFILAHAEQEGVICSGPRIGKQMTYALIDERVPLTKPLARDEALAELTRRYFKSHGPATTDDFAWWSGLSAADIRAGVSMVKRELVAAEIGGNHYWWSHPRPRVANNPTRAYLLPTYDEYLIGYKDRSAALGSRPSKEANATNPVFSSPVVIDSRVVGTWKRTLQNDTAVLKIDLAGKCNKAERLAIADAANRYGEFLGVKVKIESVVH